MHKEVEFDIPSHSINGKEYAGILEEINLKFAIDGILYPIIDGIRLKKMDPEYTNEMLREDLGLNEDSKEGREIYDFFSGTMTKETMMRDKVLKRFVPREGTEVTDYMNVGMSIPEILEKFSDPNNYDPFSCAEVIVKYGHDATRFMQAMKIIGPKRMFEELGATLIDKKTLTKTRKNISFKKGFEPPKLGAAARTFDFSSDMFEDRIDVYEDTYALYKIKMDRGTIKGAIDKIKGYGSELPDNIGRLFSNSGPRSLESLMQDAYVLHCACPSSGNDYYLFVEPSDDAFKAVANTFEDHTGRKLSVEEWKNIESET